MNTNKTVLKVTSRSKMMLVKNAWLSP